jgi:hypothetical protein
MKWKKHGYVINEYETSVGNTRFSLLKTDRWTWTITRHWGMSSATWYSASIGTVESAKLWAQNIIEEEYGLEVAILETK